MYLIYNAYVCNLIYRFVIKNCLMSLCRLANPKICRVSYQAGDPEEPMAQFQSEYEGLRTKSLWCSSYLKVSSLNPSQSLCVSLSSKGGIKAYVPHQRPSGRKYSLVFVGEPIFCSIHSFNWLGETHHIMDCHLITQSTEVNGNLT